MESGFVEEPHHWNRACELTEGNYSSAKYYAGFEDDLPIILIGRHELQARASGGIAPFNEFGLGGIFYKTSAHAQQSV